jgi:hypothetical protein
MPLVVATLSESKAPAIGMDTVLARAINAAGRPGPSEPSSTAARAGRLSSARMVSPAGLRARGVKPWRSSRAMGSSSAASRANGVVRAAPTETRMA